MSLLCCLASMSRRKQAFPVRVEGTRLHLSVESGPSSIQKSSEPTSNQVLPDKCDSNVPDEDVHNRPSIVVSSGEFIDSGAVCEEPKTSVLSFGESKACGYVHNDHDFTENETKHDILSSVEVESPIVLEDDSAITVKVESPIVLEDDSAIAVQVESPIVLEDDSAITSACSNSSFVKEGGCCTVKDELCNFRIDVKKPDSSVVDTQEFGPEHQSRSYTDHSCKEVGTSAEICRDLNVRTSLVCKAGTEIKIIQNTSAEKVEIQCVTNLAEITFEIHKKPEKQIEGSFHENNAVETVEQVHSVQENLESKETVLQDILPCAGTSDKKLEPLIISSCMDSVPDVKENSVSTPLVDERKQCERVVISPEPDSNTILLEDISELNIPDEDTCVGSSHILPDAELIVADDIYNEPDTDVLADDDEALPPIKVEPCIILKEEQEPLNIPSCVDSNDIVQDAGLSAFPADEVKQSTSVINIQELEPSCISHGNIQCGCSGVKNSEPCNESNIRSPLTRRVTRQSVRVEKEGTQRLTESTKSTFKAAKKQLEEAIGSFHKDHFSSTEEEEHTCAEPKNILGTEDLPVEAILPCVGVDLSLLKEQEPTVISSCKSPVIQESIFNSSPDDKTAIETSELKPLSLSHGAAAQHIQENTESTVEEHRDLNVETRPCRTRNKANRKNYAETEEEEEEEEEDCTANSKGKAGKTYRKRCQKTRRSRRRARVPQTKEQNRIYTEPEGSRLQAILPCLDVDPSLLKDETQPPIILACKDPSPVSPEGKKFECKVDTQLDSTDVSCEEHEEETEVSEDIPRNRSKQVIPCVTEEEIRCMVDFTKEALEQREKKLQQIREAVYRKRSLETDEQRQARLEKDKLRQRKRRAEETEEQREKRLLTMRLHKRIKRSMNSATGLQKNFLDYYMEEMLKYPDTQEEQGSPLNMIVSIDPSWVVRTVEKQQFKCTVETDEQRRVRLEKDMLRQRKKRAEETPEQRAKRLETMRINKRIRRAMETDEQRHRRLEYSRERQLFRRLNETDEQRKERLEREKLRQREKRASESSEERDLRLRAARERMRVRLSESSKTDMIDNLLSSDSLSS